MRYYILTYGCQMNERDSEILAGLLESGGYERAGTLSEADLILFNTCSVRHSAENKVFGKLGEVMRLKSRNPELTVAVGGCMAQLSENRERFLRLGVDVLFGTHNLHEILDLLKIREEQGRQIVAVWPEAKEVVEGLPSKRDKKITAFVNIMYGCNNFCSYCIVPYVRGRERSRKPADIIAEIKELVDSGVKEVTLLGQNVNSYGRGLEEKVDFADLLSMVNEIEGLWRIRFTTSHPRDMSQKLIDAVACLDKVCEHVHLPLQAGSNRILALMNRGYTREHYFDLVDRMRRAMPGVAVTTDLIVGFPGETEADFEDTLDAVQRIRFDAAFTFMYSPRTGTRAAELPEQLPREIKRDRLICLNEVQYRIALEKNEDLVGSEVEVLVEGQSKTNAQKLSGRTRTNRIVIFEGSQEMVGQLVKVRINEARTFALFGETQARRDTLKVFSQTQGLG